MESCPPLSDTLEAVVKDHLEVLHAAIRQRAQELALGEANQTAGTIPTVTPTQCLQAINEVAPGRQSGTTLVEQGFWSRFLSSVSPVTLISAILTIVFAAFGFLVLTYVNRNPAGGKQIDGAAYLDIAKIFAGAIVGSASVAAVSTARRSADPGNIAIAPKAVGKPKSKED